MIVINYDTGDAEEGSTYYYEAWGGIQLGGVGVGGLKFSLMIELGLNH